jgi:hypothetical protein
VAQPAQRRTHGWTGAGSCPSCRPQLAQRGGRTGRGGGVPVTCPLFCGTKRARAHLPDRVCPSYCHPIVRDHVGKRLHDGGEGCEHSPTLIPRTRPLHAPPFACHLAHAVPHTGRRAQGTRKVGRAGVLYVGRRGAVLTCDAGGGLCFPLAPPSSHVALGFCAAPLHAMGAGQEGGGAFPCGPVCPHTKGGVLSAPPPVCPLPSSRYLLPQFARLFRSMPEWVHRLSAPHMRRQGAEEVGRGVMPRAGISVPC